MPIIHFSFQHVNCLGAAVLQSWKNIRFCAQRDQIWFCDDPARWGVDMSQKTSLMARLAVSLLDCDPLTAFCVDRRLVRLEATKKCGDWQGQCSCEGLQCLEGGRGIAVFNLGEHSNRKSRAVGKLGNRDLLTPPKGPQLKTNGHFETLFRSIARAGRALRQVAHRSRGGFLIAHVSTSVFVFDLLIYGPVFLLVSYL